MSEAVVEQSFFFQFDGLQKLSTTVTSHKGCSSHNCSIWGRR